MTLKFRLLLSILVMPWLLLTLLVMAALVVHDSQRTQQLQTRLEQAVALFSPLFGAESEQRTAIATRLLEVEEVRALGIIDARRETVLELGRLRSLPEAAELTDTARAERPHIERQADEWRLLAPLPGNPPTWLVLDVDASQLTLARYHGMALAALLLMLATLPLGGLAFTALRRQQSSLREIEAALAPFAHGEVTPSLPAIPREPADLVERINTLSSHLEQARQEHQRQAEQSIAELEASKATIKAQNMALDSARQQALEASHAKSKFLANMSHEIRTPLNGLIGFCHLLERTRLEAHQREWLEHIQRASNNLMTLVNDVLDFSKLEAGRLELERLPLDMVTLVDEVLGLQAPLAHQKGLQLVGLVYDDVPTPLIGDPLRIRQVLTNLVHNAMKFTEHGEVVVRVMVEQSDSERSVLRVNVTDTGIGLSEEHQHRIFTAFLQAEVSHSREFGGTGLGLSICRQLVEQMGGEISVESKLDQGTTFSFTLPLEDNGAAERPAELHLNGQTILIDEPHTPTRYALHHLFTRWGARTLDTGEEPPADITPALLVASLPSSDEEEDWRQRLRLRLRLAKLGHPVLLLANAEPLDLPPLPLPHGGEILAKPVARATLISSVARLLDATDQLAQSPTDTEQARAPLRLLAVDDTESNRLLLRDMLSGPDIDVSLAASGEEAVHMAQRQAFDLVLMDIRMPGMDGIATTRALRHLGKPWSNAPVVAVTAHAQETERRRLLASGLDDVLVKPVSIGQLHAILHRHLDRPSAQNTISPPVISSIASDSELPPVDLELGTQLANGQRSVARERLGQLVESLRDSKAALQHALEEGDDEALLDALHSLNGACRYCGTPRLGLITESLETQLRTRGRHAVIARMDELFSAMAELRAWSAEQQDSAR